MKLLAVFLVAVLALAEAQLYRSSQTRFRPTQTRFRPGNFNSRFLGNRRFENRFDNDIFDFDRPDYNDYDKPDYDSSYLNFNRNRFPSYRRRSRFSFNRNRW